MLTYSDGKYTIDESALPAVTVQRMLQTGVNHILGNEVASAVGSKIKAAIVDGTERKASDVKTDELETYRAAHESVVATWTHDLRTAKIAAMLDGTLTVRSSGGGGVTRDPIEAACRAIAKLEVTAVLKNAGAKFPGKDASVTIGNATLTGDDLLARRLAHPEHGPRIRREAEAKVKADQRMKANAAKAAGGELDELAA